MNTKQIGNITEVESMLHFLKLGINVLRPYGDCERYDFVIDLNGKFYRIQVKTSTLSDDGKSIMFSCKSSHRKNGNIVNEKYTSDDIDYFVTTWNGKCYMVPIGECKNIKILRFSKAKNNQRKNISFARDYEIGKVINTILNKEAC